MSGAIPLPLEALRALGHWAADCAERALPIYEAHLDADSRPQAALEAIRAFAAGGKRTAALRTAGWAAHRAARESGDPAAAAAARAASLAAAIAYTHPLATIHQANHILGPAAYAALAQELSQGGDPSIGIEAIHWALARATPEVRAVLQQLPARPEGTSRLAILQAQLDTGLRAELPQS